MKLSFTEYQRLVNLCKGYDVFTNYIEDYRQQMMADNRNAEIVKEFNGILKSVFGEYDCGIPVNCLNNATPEENLIKWLKKEGVIVEERPRRVWTQDEIRELVQSNDKVLYGAMRKMYECQTADEQMTGTANHRNGIGFNGVDAGIMTSFCEFLNKTGFLTYRQKEIARKKLKKYTRQLTELANM